MASIQAKTVNGKKYWQIVQSMRVNGKPRPIVLEHLGTADSLLKRLQGNRGKFRVKSFSHGLVVCLLRLSKDLNLVSILNQYAQAQRNYFPQKPIRNNLTVGASLLLAAIGRICHPTSKRGWYNWAKQTSLSYMTRMSFAKVDSQHFWDMMDSFPVKSIENAETQILQNVRKQFNLNTSHLFYDTTNFYTYIATTNERCHIAQRGKNKQKRTDLRQVGLAMVVSKDDFIPLFHEAYRGNMNDSPVFRKMILKLRQRMKELKMDIADHTIVFDRGCNSKANLKLVSDLKMFYVGALTPYHHRSLIEDAENNYHSVKVDEKPMRIYRTKKDIWGEERTVLVFVSNKLKEGQIRGIYTEMDKKLNALNEFRENLGKPRKKKYSRTELIAKLDKMTELSPRLKGVIEWKVKKTRNGPYYFEYSVNDKKLKAMEDSLGFRILMTNRHDWSTESIVKSYYGQSFIENAFRNIKNPFHLALIPEFHWTDQKINVHFFSCVIGFTLATLIWKIAKDKMGYKGSLDSLLEKLNSIRLATLIEESGGKGKPKVSYQLEEMEEEEKKLVEVLGIANTHRKKLTIDGFSVYK